MVTFKNQTAAIAAVLLSRVLFETFYASQWRGQAGTRC